MKKTLQLIGIISLVLVFSCSTDKFPEQGTWRGALQIGDEDSPEEIAFNFEITGETQENISIIIRNAGEKINVNSIRITSDSLFFKMPVFDSEFRLKIKSGRLEGRWYNYANGEDYYIQFIANHGTNERYPVETDAEYNISGKWETIFGSDSKRSSKAIGEFKQDGNIVTGTFITETGDYRFLEGIISGNKMTLSCFDGAHSFLFTANILEDNLMEGMFKPGKRGGQEWRAIRNENATIGDPYSLTYLKEGYDNFEFSFPDEDGINVSLNDERYLNKVVIVQIMGSWCPNCMDETVFLSELYEKYHDQGLEIIGLAYEKAKETEQIWKNIKRLKNFSGAKYPFLYAGTSNKKQAAETLPMLNHILSFPTTIYIDKKGEIQKIFTGFMGPGTGEHYETHLKEINELLEDLLSE
ncbi:peroxiredoxin family protein [Bacteroidota bacterium]